MSFNSKVPVVSQCQDTGGNALSVPLWFVFDFKLGEIKFDHENARLYFQRTLKCDLHMQV